MCVTNGFPSFVNQSSRIAKHPVWSLANVTHQNRAPKLPDFSERFSA